MIIANPIYDTVFKFLMEDIPVAKRVISAIIGEEIIDLAIKPQEQTTFSDKYLLTVFRLDFKAIIRTIDGNEKKVLIELQKSKNSFDVMRFRNYIGTNYSNADEIDGFRTILPIVPIYFLGFNLSIKRPVLKIGRQYQDLTTGEIIDEKDEFIENLSHDCFVVQIPNLHTETITKLEKILSIFNQKWIFDNDQKWLLKFDSENVDEDIKAIVKRLSLAAESNEVREQIKVEETFDDSMDRALREKEKVIEQKEAIIEQKDVALEQKDAALEQKNAALEQKNTALEQKEIEIEELKKLLQAFQNK